MENLKLLRSQQLRWIAEVGLVALRYTSNRFLDRRYPSLPSPLLIDVRVLLPSSCK